MYSKLRRYLRIMTAERYSHNNLYANSWSTQTQLLYGLTTGAALDGKNASPL